MSLVQVERHGSVALLRLDDPKRRNILSPAMCADLSKAVKAAEGDLDVCALVIIGAAPVFCAGADLDDLKAAAAGRTENIESVYRSFMEVADCRLPTIAAVNGAAVGAGLNLALACDIRLASEKASFDTRFLKIGLHPGGGHTWMLLRAVGWAEASRMLLLGQPVRAQEARMSGLVQQVVEPERLTAAAIELARMAETLPRALITASKTVMRLAVRNSHNEVFEQETKAQLHSLRQPPFQNLLARLEADLGRV